MTTKVQDVIMLLGDSITQGGWEAGGLTQRLAHVYARKLDIINRGLSGYNTDWAIPVFEQCFGNQHEQQHLPKVRILTIWYGANDAATVPPQEVPLSRFISNIERLVHTVTSPTSPRYSPDTHVVLITPPPIDTYLWGQACASWDPPQELNRNFEKTKLYADAVRTVARKENVGLVDAWTEIYDAAGRDERALDKFLYDGLHLSADGYEIVYNALMKTISEKYPELHYDKMKTVFPLWDEIDYEHPSLIARK